jgi:hypothetical protein
MAQQLELFPKPPRDYAVSVDGYGDAQFKAASPSKARYKAYRAFCEAFTRKTFREFFVMSRVRRTKQGGAS